MSWPLKGTTYSSIRMAGFATTWITFVLPVTREQSESAGGEKAYRSLWKGRDCRLVVECVLCSVLDHRCDLCWFFEDGHVAG
jgi:hypothetical protein